jgi:hypothetical protein
VHPKKEDKCRPSKSNRTGREKRKRCNDPLYQHEEWKKQRAMAEEDVHDDSVHDATADSSRFYDAAKTLAAVLTEEGLREREAAMRKEFEGMFEAAKRTAMRVANGIAARVAASVGLAPDSSDAARQCSSFGRLGLRASSRILLAKLLAGRTGPIGT